MHYFSPKTGIILNRESLETFPKLSGKIQRCPLLPQMFNIVLQILIIIILYMVRQGKNIIQIEKTGEISLQFSDELTK